jgi:HAD superfamily hydrolase (TIGR01509 family)
LLFDLDGVLVDTEPVHRATWIEAFARLGVELTPEEESYLQGRRAEQVVAWLRERRGEAMESFDVETLVRHKRELFAERVAKGVAEVPGAEAFLRRQKGVLPLGLVSSAGLKSIGRVMFVMNWRNVFDALIGAEHVAKTKPDPEPFLKAAARFRLDPKECLVFEDSHIGIESALAAGAPVCGVATTLSPATLLEAGARWTIPDFRDEATLDKALAGEGSGGGLMASIRRAMRR